MMTSFARGWFQHICAYNDFGACTWLLRPVQRTRLNLSLSDAMLARFLNTVISFGGSVLGL